MLDGLVALVTGRARGWGPPSAGGLAADGAVVVVNDLDAEAAEATAKEVGGDGRHRST